MKNVYREQACLNGIKGSMKSKTRYKTTNGKAVLQFPEQKNRRGSIKSQYISYQAKILKMKEVCARFVPHLLMPDQ
jgi:hypothetical protein